jgi:hypothetical protein
MGAKRKEFDADLSLSYSAEVTNSKAISLSSIMISWLGDKQFRHRANFTFLL